MKNSRLKSFDDIFGTETTNEKSSKNSIAEIALQDLKAFKNHPFKLYGGKRLDDMVESIKDLGIVSPVIVRVIVGGDYEILSGHNRVNAASIVGLETVPCLIKEVESDEEAMIIVTETNMIQRSFMELLPSEKAIVLKIHHDALVCQGRRKDLIGEIEEMLNSNEISTEPTSSQVGKKSTTIEIIGTNYNMSKNTVARYIRLTYLIKPLLDLIDDGKIAFISGVNISYLSNEHQDKLHIILNESDKRLDIKKSEAMKISEQNSELTDVLLKTILEGNSKFEVGNTNKKSLKIGEKMIKKHFIASLSKEEMLDLVDNALTYYFEYHRNTTE